MASPSFFRSSTRSDLSVCARCAFRASNGHSKITSRWIGRKYSAKVATAEEEWQQRATDIRNGKEKSMFTKLEERGLVHAITGTREDVDRMMTEKRIGAYVGIDPTASSLHIGHMLPLMSLFWMYVHGYHTISLLGGATAKIGDPTDRLTTRENTKVAIRTQNMVNMHYQLEKLWLNVEAYGEKYGYGWNCAWRRALLLNNSAWWNNLPMIEVLQILGPGMRLGSMLARDTVKNKMKNGDGMSYAEFSYPIMQGWDWWHMYRANGVQLQIGGSDQYGNITAGVDAVKYISANHHDPNVREEVAGRGTPFGFTVPLLTTSSGQKFGKSAGNAIWLDVEQTSSFELYKFFLGTSDADVGRYLKLFTFMPNEQIDALVEEHMQSASQRKAQHTLAREFVELVHGVKEAQYAESQHRLIFSKSTVSPKEWEAAQAALASVPQPSSAEPQDPAMLGEHINLNNRPQPHLKLPRSAMEGLSIGRLMLACGLAESSSEGHRLASRSSVYVGGLGGAGDAKGTPMHDGLLEFKAVTVWKPENTQQYLIDNKLLIFRRGKNNIRVIEVVSDAEYKELDLTYPGMRKPVPMDGDVTGAEAVYKHGANDTMSDAKAVRYQKAPEGKWQELPPSKPPGK